MAAEAIKASTASQESLQLTSGESTFCISWLHLSLFQGGTSKETGYTKCASQLMGLLIFKRPSWGEQNKEGPHTHHPISSFPLQHIFFPTPSSRDLEFRFSGR